MEPRNVTGQFQSFQDQFHSSYDPNDHAEFTLFSEPPFPRLYSLKFGVSFQVFLVRYAWYSLICWYFLTLTQHSILDFYCSTKKDDCPGEGNGNPLQYFCLENSKDRRAWQATVHGVARESDMTKQPENLYFYCGASHCEFFNVLLNTIHNF